MVTRTQNEIVMYDSPEAASIQTLTGWVSRDGRYFGEDESLARYCGSTHRVCETDSSHPPYLVNGYCDICYNLAELKRFSAMPLGDWDRVTALYLPIADLYFFSPEHINEYCEDNGLNIANLNFVLCEPINMDEVDPEYWQDSFAEDIELPDEVQAALDALNASVRNHGKAVSWIPGDKRVVLNQADLEVADNE